MSVLSWVLLAELAVGRIIRAMKLSLTGFAPISLTRELGRSGAVCAGREGRDGCRRTAPVGPAALLSVDGFLARVAAGFSARPVAGPALPCLALDDWVCAVIELGRRTGLVGDLDRALLAVLPVDGL
jgi:hypothetical protein